MTNPQTGSARFEKLGLPTNHSIRQAVAEIASKVDLDKTSFNHIHSLVAEKLEVETGLISPKKIQKYLDELDEEESSSDDPRPNKNEVRKAAKILALKVDLETTTFKKFVKLLEKKLDCHDLTSATTVIQKVYDDGRDRDAKIIKAAKKLARSSKVDLENISNHKFLSMLQDQETLSEIDLSSKEELVYKTLKECQSNHHAKRKDSLPVVDISSSQPRSNTEFNSHQHVDEEVATYMHDNPNDNTSKIPKTIVGIPKSSLDLEQGCKIPEAAGMKWTDNFFDKETDDLVAVFDHDYQGMFHYLMIVRMVTEIFPIFLTIMVIAMIILGAGGGVGGGAGVMFLLAFVYLGLTLYGAYRLVKSYVYSLHLAVKRDGICVVQDDHIEGLTIVAALHIFDSCIFVSKQSQTIPFDQITALTVKDPGEMDKHYIRVPFYSVAMDTGSSCPGYFASVMDGLCLPHEFQKLVWGMKRDKGEEIHRRNEQNTANLCAAMMFDNMMKYGMSPVQPPLPGTIGNSGKTAPTVPVSIDSISSSNTPKDGSRRSSNGINL